MPAFATRFVLALCVLAAQGAAAQSVMFRGGPEHTGVYESAAPSLTLAWKFAAAGPVVSSPLVVGDAVYFGSNDHFIYAVDRLSGAARWKFQTRGAVNSSPAFANGLVMAASVDGQFYAIDAATGKKKWSFATKGESRFTAPGIHGATPHTEMMADPFDVFISSPVIAGDAVYFGSGDHNVYALDIETGALRWKFATGNVVHASPAISEGVLYIGSWDRNMYALDAKTGAERWRFQTGGDTVIYNQVGIASSAAVSGGIVFFGCRDGHFYALDAKTGHLKWSHDNKGGWVIASPAVSNGVVYFPTADGMRFKALDAATGTLKYSLENKSISFSSPAIAGGSLYFGSSDGWLHMLDAATGRTSAEFRSDGSIENAAKYIDENGRMKSDALYPDITLDGMIIGVHRMFTLGSMLSSPAIAGGMVFIGGADGKVYALR